ncbi:MAG: PASTA domain-containing protein [Clostridia bacterium]|nr:PASTA domain-containing protein [Clostridia bacterium]MBQ3128652.1 PASTA domain-containing protein [Clostridia bacterium]
MKTQLRVHKKKLLKPRKILTKGVKMRIWGILALFLVIGFIFPVAGLVNAQIINGDFFKLKAQQQQLNDTVVPANRGIIYDRNMTVLAQSASAWKITFNPSEFAKFPDAAKEIVFDTLPEILGIERETLEEKAALTGYNNLTLVEKVEKDIRDKVLEFVKEPYESGKKGEKAVYYSSAIMVEDDVKRYFPYSTLASQILGCVGTDNDGLSGLESKYNDILKGIDGRLISTKANNTVIESIAYQTLYEPTQGTGLVLTIDETIQRYLEEALSECYETSNCLSATGIVMDVDTGAILAMSSQASFDSNDPYNIYDTRTVEKLNEIEDEAERKKAYTTAMYQQWRNRGVSDLYDPGSVFKVITMAAGLEENVVEYDETFNCGGSIQIMDRHYWCHNHSGHGTQTLTQGLMNSCNPYFITIGQRLGVETFYKYFEAFGFTEKTGIDLGAEALPKAGINYHSLKSMTKVNLASSSFGQSFQASPIQVLNAINAVVNDGKLMQPYIVAKTLDADGNVISETKPTVKRQVISESTSDKIIASMEQVSTAGTAKNSYVAGYRVAGKTGTSDVLGPTGATGEYIASFAGCAPANDPEISIIIVVNEPQGQTGGGAVAAPVAAEVIEKTLTYLNIERQYTESEKSKLDEQVPNLTAKTVSEARAALKELGLKIKVVGAGESVVSQMPAYSQYIPQGGVVVVYTDEEEAKTKVVVPDFTGMSVSQVNYEAVKLGINVKISGNSLSASGLTAYRQSIQPEKEVECGSTVTVYFRTTSGVSDH